MGGIRIGELAGARGAEKVILFHPSPWLGLSFIGLILFVVVFTTSRAGRLLDRAAAADRRRRSGRAEDPGHRDGVWLGQFAARAPQPRLLPDLLVLLMGIWLFVTSWSTASPGGARPARRPRSTATGMRRACLHPEGMTIQRRPDDLFRHRLLGFGHRRLRGQAGDGGRVEIHNVWRAKKKQRCSRT